MCCAVTVPVTFPKQGWEETEDYDVYEEAMAWPPKEGPQPTREEWFLQVMCLILSQ